MVQAFKNGKEPPANNTFVEDVRHFMWDRTIEDNDVELDLAYSDEEIHQAARHMALSFNAIPPFVFNISGAFPPITSWSLHGTAMHLLIAKYHKVSRNDVTYQAGGMTAEYTNTLLKHIKDQIKFHEMPFKSEVKSFKINANINAAFDTNIG